MKKILIPVIFLLVVNGCAFSNIKKADKLRPGMTSEEVRNLLGHPSFTKYRKGHVLWRYGLRQFWVRRIPHYLAFRADSMTLVNWQAIKDDDLATVKKWVDSLPDRHSINAQEK